MTSGRHTEVIYIYICITIVEENESDCIVSTFIVANTVWPLFLVEFSLTRVSPHKFYAMC